MLFCIQGGADLGLFEVNEAARLVQEAAHPEANIIFGAVIDDNIGDECRVTVIAAGFDSTVAGQESNVVEAVPAGVGASSGPAVVESEAETYESSEPETSEPEPRRGEPRREEHQIPTSAAQ